MEPINNPVVQDNGKTVGIISYLTFVGWLIAYFGFHQNNKTSLGSYQLRQTLLLYIVAFVFWIVLDVVLVGLFWASGGGFYLLYWLLRLVQLGFFVLWIIGIIGAANGQEKPIPVIGPMAQKMFSGI
jgi:uncharacterized membrane protein